MYEARWLLREAVLTEKGVFCIISAVRGAVAQLGEYVTGSHGVAGSSPVSSTIFLYPYLRLCLPLRPPAVWPQGFSVQLDLKFMPFESEGVFIGSKINSYVTTTAFSLYYPGKLRQL